LDDKKGIIWPLKGTVPAFSKGRGSLFV